MANVTESLFGITPEALQAQRDAVLQENAYKFAQLSPMQAAQAGFYTAGNRLGGAAGGLLGAEDPQLKLVRQRQQVLQGINPADVQSLKQAASRLASMGDYQGAQLLSDKALSTEKEQSVISKNNRVNPGTASERNRQMLAAIEVKLANNQPLTAEEEAQARWLVANESKPKMFRDSESGDLITVQPLDINQAAPNLAKFLGKGGATAPAATEGETPSVGTTTQIAPGITTTKVTEGKGLDASLVKELATTEGNITKLNSSVKSLDDIGTRIDNLNLGMVQNFIRSGAAALGKNTPDTVEFDRLQRIVKQEANNLLLLAKGAQTEGDAQRAVEQIAKPDTWKNKESLKAAFDDLKSIHQRTLQELEAKKEVLRSKGKSTAPSKPSSSGDTEALISRWMKANNASREETIAELKRRGKL